ncbi:tetratricopeptide repeat protein (plasmid) [Bernardetia sp. Wsw4-3y2]|uniref:tetratricopeptide repeat protein n=1 Tax=unclassified Bernardetia TaxID=2647129 RepID=UPI0030CAF627
MISNSRREEPSISITEFERLMEEGRSFFFEIDTYEFLLEHYRKTGNIERLFSVCDIARSQHPFSVNFIVEEARAHIINNDFDKAQSTIEEAEALQPSEIEVQLTKAWILQECFKFDEAAEIYQNILPFTDEKEKDEVLYQIASCYQAKNDLKTAIKYYKETLRQNKGHKEALYELAFCYDELDDLEGSIVFYKQFIDNDPYSAEAWYNLALIQTRLSLYRDAIVSYDYASLIEDGFSSAFFNKGNCHMNLGQYQEALDCFIQTSKLERPTAELYTHIGAAYQKLNKFAEALNFYRKALDFDQEYEMAAFGIGECMEEQERWKEAVHFYQKSLRNNKNLGNAWFGKARCEYQLGNMISCMEAYDHASRILSENVDVWLSWSHVYYKEEWFDKAIAITEEALEIIPDSAELLYRYVAYLMGGGKYKAAVMALENAILIAPEDKNYILEFFTDLNTQKAIYQIIEQLEN